MYADKRDNPNGRLPDDTWILRPQDLPEGFQPADDTWYFARVAGTFKERQGFHGCQMPEQLLGRIIRVSSNPGDIVLDPFAGSGTTLAAAKKLGRKWIGCELSEEYARAATERRDPPPRPVDGWGRLAPVIHPLTGAPLGHRPVGHDVADEAALCWLSITTLPITFAASSNEPPARS